MQQAGKYSDFIVYVDESGDHSLTSIDPAYPVFVLAFCIFYKQHYAEKIVPKLQQLKFEYFGHDLVILHEHEIRKEKGDFSLFKNRDEKEQFLNQLTDIIEQNNFILASCVIEKAKLNKTDSQLNPYHFALRHCLETLFDFVTEKGQQEQETYVVVEKRGHKEDNELELEFLRICSGQNKFNQILPFKLKMASKQINSAGLQLADLVARPIGRYILNPKQENRAFDVLRRKFYCEGGRKDLGKSFDQKGLKHFPEQ